MSETDKSEPSEGTAIAIEVVEIHSAQVSARGSSALERLNPGAQAVSGQAPTEVLDLVTSIGSDELERGLALICRTVTSALRSASPDTCSVELNIGFKANAKVPILMSGEANAALKVTLGWKKVSAATTTG